MPWDFGGHVDKQFGRINPTIGVMARSSFAKASKKEDFILAPGQVEQYSGIGFPFDPGVRVIHDHFESSWLDNERGVFDDINGRNLFVAITSNENKPIGTVSKRAHETKTLSLPKLILSTSSDTQTREVSEVKSDSVFFDRVREFNLDIMSFNTWIQLCLNFEKIRVASSLYYQMPNNGAFLYLVLAANVTIQHLLLPIPFDPGLAILVVLIEFTKLVIEHSLSNRAVATARHILVEASSLSLYFCPYGQVLQEGMLQDFVRPRISENCSDFFDRTLVLVGVTIGILPLVVSQAGVLHVYAIKTSGMVGYARKLLSGSLLVAERIISIKGKAGLLKITPLAAVIFQIREDYIVSMMLTTSVFSSPKVFETAMEPSNDTLSVHQLVGTLIECRVIYNMPMYNLCFEILFMAKMSPSEGDDSTGVYFKQMAAKEDWKEERIANLIPAVLSFRMQFSCLDEAFHQAGEFKNMAAIIHEFIVYLELDNCSCILGLHLIVDMQMSCCKRVNEGHVWWLFLQELKALTSLKNGGDYSDSRDSKALVAYLEGLRGLNNSKDLYFMNPLWQTLPSTSILRKHFQRVAHNYEVLLLNHGWPYNSFSFLEPNLEDKVLIEGGSIVMNGPEVLVYGPINRSLSQQQPKTNLCGYVWDPG